MREDPNGDEPDEEAVRTRAGEIGRRLVERYMINEEWLQHRSRQRTLVHARMDVSFLRRR